MQYFQQSVEGFGVLTFFEKHEGAKGLGVNYNICDVLQSDNARLMVVLTGKESDIEIKGD